MKFSFTLPKKVKAPSAASVIRYTKLGLLTVGVLLLAGLGFFLYRNVYVPITQAASVAFLKEQVALVTIKRAKYDRLLMLRQIDREPANAEWETLRDPFKVAPPPAQEDEGESDENEEDSAAPTDE